MPLPFEQRIEAKNRNNNIQPPQSQFMRHIREHSFQMSVLFDRMTWIISMRQLIRTSPSKIAQRNLDAAPSEIQFGAKNLLPKIASEFDTWLQCATNSKMG